LAEDGVDTDGHDEVEGAVVPVDDGLGRDWGGVPSAFPGSDKSTAKGDGDARDGVCALDKSIKWSIVENDGNLLCTAPFANGGSGRAGVNFPIIGLYVLLRSCLIMRKLSRVAKNS
jgi:hypothetical protein